ncbi:MAG: tyrosine-type recombinase/integrase [Planctomycetes bacterium]|nr:tyrosine-type recombinase/integrase [Planctomycetota bacterium]
MDRVHLRKKPGRTTFEVSFTHNGKRVFQALKTSDRRAAAAIRADLEYKLRNRILQLPREIPLEAAIDAFINYQKGRRTPKGLKIDEGYLRRTLAKMGVDDLTNVTSEGVRAQFMAMRADDYKAKTINRYREVLHCFCHWAMKESYLFNNPIARVERYPEPAPEIRYLSKEEQSRAINLFRARGPQLLPLIATCLYAGLRRAEAIWLVRENIDIQAGYVRVLAKRVGDDSWQPKTRRNRAVPISPLLREILKEAFRTPSASPWAFPSPQGLRWDEDNLSQRIRGVLKNSGMQFNLLTLRHTFGTMLAMKGIPTFKVAHLMGNSEQMVRRHYAAFIVEETKEDVAF